MTNEKTNQQQNVNAATSPGPRVPDEDLLKQIEEKSRQMDAKILRLEAANKQLEADKQLLEAQRNEARLAGTSEAGAGEKKEETPHDYMKKVMGQNK
jgi:hypothetical protein